MTVLPVAHGSLHPEGQLGFTVSASTAGGDSTDTHPYDIGREVEDLGALIDAVGGSTAVYGHSSGAGLALHGAAGGLPINGLVLHEPPYGPDDAESTEDARAIAESVRAALAEDRRADAVRLFLEAAGMPPEMVVEMSGDPDAGRGADDALRLRGHG